MRIKIDKNISIPLDKLIKRCGYAEIKDKTGRVSYVRRLRGYRYPRFHIYIGKNELTLHLDQKAPIYQNMSAHCADYEGEVLEKEVERIKKILEMYK